MTNKIWVAEAPSNIALIKYMGKTEKSGNRPTNGSLSYSLDHLRTRVELSLRPDGQAGDQWAPLNRQGWQPLTLSTKGQERFLKHLQMLKSEFGFSAGFLVQSANNFPSDCGLASSASSFAALTLAGVRAIREMQGKMILTPNEISILSRKGSGSSCRSLFEGFSLWRDEGAERIDLGIGKLWHQVILVDDSLKAVSSSEAHLRVASSDLFNGRVERAERRLKNLIALMREKKWRQSFEICWQEFWDMHALFETSNPAFGYMRSGSLDVLNFVREQVWGKLGDGPLVTMDAGANVHLLYREDQADLARMMGRQLGEKWQVISNLS